MKFSIRVSFLIALILFFLLLVTVISPKQDGGVPSSSSNKELTAHEKMLERTQPQRRTNAGTLIERGADIHPFHNNTYRDEDELIDWSVAVIRDSGYRCDSVASFSWTSSEVFSPDKADLYVRALDAGVPAAERPEIHDTIVDTVVKCNKGRDEYRIQVNMDSKELQVTRD